MIHNLLKYKHKEVQLRLGVRPLRKRTSACVTGAAR